MPTIDTTPIQMGNDLVIRYEGGATTTLETYTFPSVQETTTIFNDSVHKLTAIASGKTHLIPPNVTYQITDDIDSFQIKTVQGIQPFRVEGRVNTLGTKDTYARNEIVKVNTQLAQKASQNITDSLQAQVNAIVLQGTSGDSSAEVAQGRIDTIGASFPTLKERFDNIETIIKTGKTSLKFNDWVVGAIDNGTGGHVSSTTRIRTNNFHSFPSGKNVNVAVASGYRIYVLYYDENQVYKVANSGWKTTDFVLESHPYYKFMISANPEAAATTAIANNIVFSFMLDVYTSNGSTIVVDQAGKGHYKTIAEACGSAKDGDTILVHPGTYIEAVDIRSKEVSIIGINKHKCILKSQSNSYDNPPIEMSRGYIENMTIYAEKLVGATNPADGRMPYSVHLDYAYSKDGHAEFFNCKIVSDWNSALGIGFKSGFTLKFRDCEIISNADTTNGAFFFHDADVAEYMGTASLVVDGCVIKSVGSYVITPVSYGDVRNVLNMTWYRNVIWSNVNGATNAGIGIGRAVSGTGWRQYNNFFLTPDSFGNNHALFNV